MKPYLCLSLLFLASAVSFGQAIPAGEASSVPNPSVSGFNFLSADGELHYSLTASEVAQFGYSGIRATSTTAFSANAAYANRSSIHPLSFLLGGGALLPNQSGQSVSGFTTLSVSQGYMMRYWTFNVGDSVSFLPQSPTVGLSGLPGLGDLGTIPTEGPGQGPAGGILTISGNRISNMVFGNVERKLGRNTSISGAGTWSVLHFLDDTAGLNNSQTSGSVSLNHHLDARSSVNVSAVYTAFSYNGPEAGPLAPNFKTKGLNVGYQRVLTHSLSVSGSVGPQWVSSANGTLIPTSLNVAATANVAYTRKFTNAMVYYSRGANGGSGVLPGALSDTTGASVGRELGPNWGASASVGYSKSRGLTQIYLTSPVPVNEIYHSVYGSIQVTHRLTQKFSGYASYSAQNQSTNYPNVTFTGGNVLSGISQTFGIGITFSPRATHVGQF